MRHVLVHVAPMSNTFSFASYRFLALLRYLARYVAQKVRRGKSRAAGGSEESRKRAWETEGRRPRRSGGKVTIGTADYPGLLLRAAGELSFQTQQGGQCLQGNGPQGCPEGLCGKPPPLVCWSGSTRLSSKRATRYEMLHGGRGAT